MQCTLGDHGEASGPGHSLASECGDPYPQVAFRVQVACDELQEELLGAARILPGSILVLGHDLIEGAQAGVHVLRSSTITMLW